MGAICKYLQRIASLGLVQGNTNVSSSSWYVGLTFAFCAVFLKTTTTFSAKNNPGYSKQKQVMRVLFLEGGLESQWEFMEKNENAVIG